MSKGEYTDLDEYGLKHLAEHLYRPGLYAQLYDLTTSRQWFDTQTAFDPSRQTYAESLDWTLRAAEADPHGLPTLLELSLLRPTVNVLATQVPTAVLEVMVRLGAVQRAESYAELRNDLPSKCEALCLIADARCQRGDTMGARETLLKANHEVVAIEDLRKRTLVLCCIAHALGLSEDEKGARETLSQAEHIALSIMDPRSRTHLLARVGVVAREIGVPDALDRTVQAIRTAFEHGKSNAAVMAQELHLLDRPDYLLALAKWEQTESALYFLQSRNDALAVVARVAAAQKDDTLLDEILALAHRKIRTLWAREAEPIVKALTEAGRVDDAFALLETWRRQYDFDDVGLREAIAMAAGRRGDLATIERAISPVYSKRVTSDTDDSPDWEERLERITGATSRFVKRVGWHVVGMGNYEKLVVQLAGIEGLADEHPEQAKALWERAKAEKGWFWRRMAPIVEELYPQQIGISKSGQVASAENGRPAEPAGLVGVLFRLSAFAARWDDEAAEGLAMFGRFEQALEAAQKIDDPERRDSVLAGVADTALEMGNITQAMAVADAIDKPETRKRVLDTAAEALAKQPRDDAMRLLDPFAAQADRLDKQASLVRSQALPALMREVARFGSIEDALRMVQALDTDAVPVVLPALCEVTVMQDDIKSARQLLVRAEKADEGGDLAKALAQISAQWAKAAAVEQDSALANEWTDLAARAFRLAQSQTNRLRPKGLPPEFGRRWILPSLALAARHLKDRSALSALHKQAKTLASTQWVVNQALADNVLIHVIMGLASPDDYLGSPLVEEIWHREYRAQVQVEMSEVVRSLLPQKKLFWTHRSKEDLQSEARLLLDNVRKELTPDIWHHQFMTRFGGQMPLADSLKKGAFLDRYSLQKSAVDERSLFARIGEESWKPKPTDEEQTFLERSGRDAVAQAFEAFAKAGRYDDIAGVAQNTPPPSNQPVVAAAVTALVQAGQVEPARRLLQKLESKQDKALALASLAGGLAASNAVQAEALLDQAMDFLWESSLSEITLAAIADVARSFPPLVRLRVVHYVLRVGRERGRSGAFQAIGSLAPALPTLMDASQWRDTVEKIIETESWWRQD